MGQAYITDPKRGKEKCRLALQLASYHLLQPIRFTPLSTCAAVRRQRNDSGRISGSPPHEILVCGVESRFQSVMAIDRITVRGARQHNLKNINVDIPRDKLTVITGLSGSGKSSLAFDTIYAEGQRRYVESLSAY